MPRFMLVALNGPTKGEGDEDTYNKWYDEVHAADLMSVPGAIVVRRFRTVFQNRVDQPYMNVTEFEAESIEALMAALGDKASAFIPEIDRSRSVSAMGQEIEKA